MINGCKTRSVSHCLFKGRGKGECMFYTHRPLELTTLCFSYDDEWRECLNREARRAEKPEEEE